MSYLDMYKSRLNASGVNSGESIINSTKKTASNNFDMSPFSENVLIDDVEYKAIITQGETSKEKSLLLRPETVIENGANVKINDSYYLITDFRSEGINEIYPTASLEKCNSTFPAITDKTRVLIGRDDDNRPVYDEIENVIQVPCIVETSISINTEKSDQLLLPKGSMKVSMKYATYQNIETNTEFEMYGSKYKIEDVDCSKVINGVGIMVIYAKKDVKE